MHQCIEKLDPGWDYRCAHGATARKIRARGHDRSESPRLRAAIAIIAGRNGPTSVGDRGIRKAVALPSVVRD